MEEREHKAYKRVVERAEIGVGARGRHARTDRILGLVVAYPAVVRVLDT